MDTRYDDREEIERLKRKAKGRGWKLCVALVALLLSTLLFSGEAFKNAGELFKKLATQLPRSPEGEPDKDNKGEVAADKSGCTCGADKGGKLADKPEVKAVPQSGGQPLTSEDFWKGINHIQQQHEKDMAELRKRVSALETGPQSGKADPAVLEQYRAVIAEQSAQQKKTEELLERMAAQLKATEGRLEAKDKEVSDLKLKEAALAKALDEEKKTAKRLADNLAKKEAEAKQLAADLAKKKKDEADAKRPVEVKWFADVAPCGKAVSAHLRLDGVAVPVLCAGGRVYMWAVDTTTGRPHPPRQLTPQELKGHGLSADYYQQPVLPRVL